MCFEWVNERIKKLTCTDIGITKLCVFAFALLIAKLWPPILSLDWYWYGLAFAVTWVYLMVRFFRK